MNWDREKMSKSQIKTNKNPIIHRNDIDLTFWFLNVLRRAALQAKIRMNHKMISINFQNMLGEHIVMIQNIMVMIANEINSQNGRDLGWLLFSICIY